MGDAKSRLESPRRVRSAVRSLKGSQAGLRVFVGQRYS